MFQMKLVKKLKTSFEIRLSHNFRWLCHNTNNKTLVFEINTGEDVAVLNKPANPSRIRFSQNDEYLVIKNTSGGNWVYKTADFELLKVFKSRKSYKLIDQGFNITEDEKMILDIIETKYGDQVVTLNMDTGEQRVLTNFKDSLISYNDYSHTDKFHLFNLRFINKQTGDGENKLLKIKEPVTEQSIQVMGNKEVFEWDWVMFNPSTDNYLLVSNYEIAIVDSEFTRVLQKETLVPTIYQDDTGYFEHISISNSRKYIVVTYSNKIFILDSKDLNILAVEELSNACFAEFSKDDRYLLIGTWDHGYVLKNDLY